MESRLGLGPVFAFEWLTIARRWQVYVVRSLFVAMLLGALALVWFAEISDRPLTTIRAQAEAGQVFFAAVGATQLALVLLVAPAAAAGAICLDKSRGTMTHLLMTDLSDAEIVLGKLAGRLMPCVGLVVCTMPVLALCTLLGGIDPMGLLGAFVVTLALAVLGCTLALTLSVWARKAQDVLMATFAIWAVWLLFSPTWWMLKFSGIVASAPPDWMWPTNPFGLALWVQAGSVDLRFHFGFLAAAIAISAVMAGAAVARVRAVTIAQSNQPARASRRERHRFLSMFWPRFLPRVSLDGNPVLWRECQRQRPTRWSRIIWSVYVTAAVGFTGLTIYFFVTNSRMGMEMTSVLVNGGQVSLGLLLLSVTAATSLAEERARGSLDVLLATPLSTQSIVWGKWWGSFRAVPWLACMPMLITIAAAWSQQGHWEGVPLIVGQVLAYGAALTSLGLAMATWVPRLGRAVGVTVTFYVAVTIGWLFLVAVLVQDNQLGPGLACASPLMGAAYTTVGMVEHRGDDWTAAFAWGVFWVIANFSVAAVLLMATMATFDRCLGRIREKSDATEPPAPAPRIAEATLSPEYVAP